ncbi:MAG: hypothetical protein CMI31_01705 [Opitutae bacterium]|nr:hypothetical protein [Opitutae bacterium]
MAEFPEYSLLGIWKNNYTEKNQANSFLNAETRVRVWRDPVWIEKLRCESRSYCYYMGLYYWRVENAEGAFREK